MRTLPIAGNDNAQLLNQMVDEVRVPVDGASHLDQGRRALLIYALEPASDRDGADQNGRGGLLFVPPTAGLELKDGEPVCRRVARAMTCREASHAGVLDAQFLAQQLDLGPQPFVVGVEADLSNTAAGAPTKDVGHGHMGHP